MGHRRYRNPPIEEALCEFHFDSDETWDLTIPGKLHTELDDYSGKPRQQNVVQVGLALQDGQPSELRHGERLGRVLLITNDGSRMVGIGPDVVSVHMLRPYQGNAGSAQDGWSEFRHRIQQALDAYWTVASPNGVKRISIRYVNRIGIPQEAANIGDYLKCALPVVAELPPRVSEFVSRTELSYEDGVRLILAQVKFSSSTDATQIVLDLDVIWETESAVGKDVAIEKAKDLRDRERLAFEAIITDKAREIFDAD